MEDRHSDDADLAQVHGNDEEISRLLDVSTLQQPLTSRGGRSPEDSPREGGAPPPGAYRSPEESPRGGEAPPPGAYQSPEDSPREGGGGPPGAEVEASLSAFMSHVGGGLRGDECLPAAPLLQDECLPDASLLADSNEDAELDAALEQAVPRDFDEVEDRFEEAAAGDEELFSEAAHEMLERATGIAHPKVQGFPLSEADVLDVARPAREKVKGNPPSKQAELAEGESLEDMTFALPPKPKGDSQETQGGIMQLDREMAVRVCGKKGEIVVRVGKDKRSEAAASNLKSGALIKIYVQDGERVCYGLICGEGPDEGWVSIFSTRDGSALLEQTDRTVAEVEEEVMEQERQLKERQAKEREQRARAQQASARAKEEAEREALALAAEQAAEQAQQELEESRRAAELAPQQRLEELKEQMESKSGRTFESDKEEAARLQKEADERVVLGEKEARERLAERLKRAAEEETLAIQDKANNDREQEVRRLAEAPDSIWVFVSPFGQLGRRYKPAMEQICWRRIFYGPVQAAFVWDDMFFVAKEDGKLAVCAWGEPWMGGYEDWGPIFKGEVQAAWVYKDMLYVVKHGGRIAATPMGTDWDGRLEEWGNSDIFKGSVQAAFVEGNKLYVIKEGRVAIENWSHQDWDGTVEDWGRVFPGSMKTAFVAEGNLYVARQLH